MSDDQNKVDNGTQSNDTQSNDTQSNPMKAINTTSLPVKHEFASDQNAKNAEKRNNDK